MADHRNLSQAGGLPKKRGLGGTVAGVLYPLLQMRVVDVTADVLTQWQMREANVRANNARQGFEMFRAFWRWCAARDEYRSVITDARAVESKDLRAEVPSRKSKRFDNLDRAHLSAWFTAVRGLNPVVSTYLQALLLTGARREEMAELRWQDVDFRWDTLWVKDKVRAEGRKIPLTPYVAELLKSLNHINETPSPAKKIKGGIVAQKRTPSEWVFATKAASGYITEPRMAHNRALSVAGLGHVTIHGLRRSFSSLAEWVEMPRGVVNQIMGHLPSATAERHYIDRPLGLLAIWHAKYEAWILEQAGVEVGKEQPSLRAITHA